MGAGKEFKARDSLLGIRRRRSLPTAKTAMDEAIGGAVKSGSPTDPLMSAVPIVRTPSLVHKTQQDSLREEYGNKEITASVSFTQVTVHYHQCRVGDHMYCEGPPVALGQPLDSEIYDNVDVYEQRRPGTRDDMYLNPSRRLELLQNAGFSPQHILMHLEEAEREMKARPKRNRIVKRLTKVFRKR